MNQKNTYEQLITEKLEGMPVPDMADAIWARIERQLDIDMPTDDGGSDPDPNSPSGSGWIGGAGLFTFVVALVTIFFINKNHKKREHPHSSPVQNVQIKDSTSVGNPIQGVIDSTQLFENRSQVLVPGKSLNPTIVDPENVTKKDTADYITPPVSFEPVNPDTSQKFTVTVPQSQGRLDSVKPKKSRGVIGITDKDYRIVPVQRDSTRGD